MDNAERFASRRFSFFSGITASLNRPIPPQNTLIKVSIVDFRRSTNGVKDDCDIFLVADEQSLNF